MNPRQLYKSFSLLFCKKADLLSSFPRLLRSSSLYFAGNVANRAVGFLMLPFYGRHLSPAQYGILSLVEFAITVVAIAFGLQSIGAALTRIYHDQPDDVQRRRVVATGFLGAIAAAILVAVLAIAFAGPIGRAIALPDQIGLLRAGFAAMVFSTIVEVALVYQRMRDRARFFLAYSLITLLATVTLNIVFIGALGLGVWGFVCSKLLVAGTGSVVLVVLTLRETGFAFAGRYARAMARFGWPLAVSSVGFYAIHFSDRLFLAHVSRADVGVYSMAYNFAFLLSVLVGDSFGFSWNVTFYSYARDPGWQDRFVRIGTWLIFALAAATVGISLLGRDTLRLMLPGSYLPPALLLPVLLLAYFCREIGDFFRNILLIGRGSGLVGQIALAGALTNLALNALLISGPPDMGIWGAALATALTWALYAVVCWAGARRTHGVVFPVWPLLRLLALGALVLAADHATEVGNAYLQVPVDLAWLVVFVAGSAWVFLGREQRREVTALLF